MSITLSEDAAAFNEAIQDPPPEVGKAAPTTVNLMRGLVDPETGEWQSVAIVSEMTGEDEEALDLISTKDNLSYAEYTSALLRRSVTSIGNLRVASDPSVLDNLIIGDRDLLFLGIIRATYGNIRDFRLICPSCKESNEVKVTLDTDFEIEEPKGDARSTREITLKDGSVVSIKYLTGKDAKAVASAGDTTAVQNTEIVTQSVVWDDDRSIQVRRSWSKGLSLADRKTIVRAVLDDQPGPRLEEVNAPCAYCSEDITMVLDWVSLLLG